MYFYPCILSAYVILGLLICSSYQYNVLMGYYMSLGPMHLAGFATPIHLMQLLSYWTCIVVFILSLGGNTARPKKCVSIVRTI